MARTSGSTAPSRGNDYTYELARVNPELNALLVRVKALYAVLGGSTTDASTTGLDPRSFEGGHTLLLIKLRNIEELCRTRDSSGLPKDSRDYIRLKYSIQNEMSEVTRDVGQLQQLLQAQASKRFGRATPEEISRQTEALRMLMVEVNNVKRMVEGRAPLPAPDATGAVGVDGVSVSADAFLGGAAAGPGGSSVPGRRVVQEALTDQQQAQLTAINAQKDRQDAILDQMMAVLDDIKETTVGINDELDLQAEMLRETEAKVDTQQTALNKVNDRMNRTLEVMNSKSTQMCSYIICLVVLLGVLTVLYNMATG